MALVGPVGGPHLAPWRRGSDFRRARIGSCALDRHMSMKKAWDIMHGASSFNQSKLGWICSTKIMKRARSSTIHMYYSYTSLIVNPIVALKIDIGSCDSGLVQHTIWKESVLQISQMQNVCKD